MEIKIYGKLGAFNFVTVEAYPPILIGKIINELPSELVQYRVDIDIKKTLHFLKEDFDVHALSVMVVDDDFEFLQLAELELLNLGHYVETFDDAETAHTKFRQEPSKYDRIIIDQKMPGVSGHNFAKLVLDSNRDAKLCILTASVENVPNTFSAQYQIIKKPCKMINIVGSAFDNQKSDKKAI